MSGTALGNAVNLGTGATLALTGANDLGLNGVIAGNGGIAQTGSGTTTLLGANTFSGGTTLSGGGPRRQWRRAGDGALNVTGAGGSLGTTVGGTVLGNAIQLGAGAALTVGGANDLGLGGIISAPAASTSAARARRR